MDANHSPTENVINTNEPEDAHLNCNEELSTHQVPKPDCNQECETENDMPEVPYIKTSPKQPYTLVLDLDETLIHYNETKSLQQAHLLAHEFRMKYKRDPTVQELTDLMPEVVFNVRPYSEYFLNEMSKFFEIIVFTAAEQAVSCVYVHPYFFSTRTKSWTNLMCKARSHTDSTDSILFLCCITTTDRQISGLQRSMLRTLTESAET